MYVYMFVMWSVTERREVRSNATTPPCSNLQAPKIDS